MKLIIIFSIFFSCRAQQVLINQASNGLQFQSSMQNPGLSMKFEQMTFPAMRFEPMQPIQQTFSVPSSQHQSQKVEEGSEDICNMSDGTYKSIKSSDGYVYFFRSQNYFVFRDEIIKLNRTASGNISDLAPETSGPVDFCFRVEDFGYFVKGDRVCSFDSSRKKRGEMSLEDFQSKFGHVIISKRGTVTGYFVPPYATMTSSKQTMQSGDYSIEISGGKQVSSSQHGPSIIVIYDGYLIPGEFSAFYVSEDGNRLYLFKNDQYSVQVKGQNQPLTWQNAKPFLGC